MVQGGTMRLTKYEHACFMVELDDQALIVDPGVFTTNLAIPNTVVAVVITHQHQDHLSNDHLEAIVTQNPEVTFIGHQDVMSQLEHNNVKTVTAGQAVSIGPFALAFFGGTHAEIHSSLPPVANLGVMINDLVYYPGDSFTVPNDKRVQLLALPVAAPWMKISEAIEFVRAIKPARVFPTHDAILSDTGKALVDRLIPHLAEDTDTHYERIDGFIELPHHIK